MPRRSGYPAMKEHTMAVYNAMEHVWDMIIEPNCEMVFEIDDYDSTKTYEWNITETPEHDIPTFGEVNDFQKTNQRGANIAVIKHEDSYISAQFRGVNVYYRVSLTMYSDEYPDGLMHIKDGVTKFVRREMRTLIESDRNKCLDAMQVVYNTSQEEGQAKYGNSFVSHAHLTGLHNSAYYIYHGNLMFITSHPTMQLKLEKSLASVHPDIVFAYWDFLLDNSLGKNWSKSKMYDNDWFGPVDTYPTDDFRLRGRFRDVKKLIDVDHKNFPLAGHSPYGFVTWYTDYNKQQYLQRSDKMCDFALTEGFSDCNEVSWCFSNYTTLYEFDMCMESHVHGNLHTMHAGLFNCEVSWKDWYEDHTWVSENRLSFFGMQMVKLMYDIQESLYTDYLDCSTKCDFKHDNYSTCNCHPYADLNWTTPSDVKKNLDAAEIRMLLQDFYEIAYDTGPYGNIWIETYTEDMTTYYKPKAGYNTTLANEGAYSYDYEENEHFMSTKDIEELELLLIQTILFSGTQGVMASGSSANDPLFWVFHQVFDKAVQAFSS